jgi:hypothetical protein
MTDELPFKVVRSNGTDEVLARAVNLLIARGAYREAASRHSPGRRPGVESGPQEPPSRPSNAPR